MFDQINSAVEVDVTASQAFLDALKPNGKLVALDFIKRLAADDSFREAMVRNPVATAASFGFTLDPAKLPNAGVKLPSKSAMARYLDIVATRFSESPDIIIYFAL